MSSPLKIKLWGQEFDSPVFLASGTAGYGFELGEIVPYEYVAGIFTKAITMKPLKGSPPGRLVETQSGVLNNIGFQNLGIEKFTEALKREKDKLHPRIFVNLVGRQSDDFSKLIDVLEGSPVIGYEINLSSAYQGEEVLGQNPKISAELVAHLRKRTKRPLLVKMFPQVARIEDDAKAYEAAGADGLVVANTLRGLKIDVQKQNFALSQRWGGLSGPGVKPIILKLVWDVCRVVKIPVVGVGGIVNDQDVLEYMMAGASAVQVGTALYRDPRVPMRICRGLETFLKDNGFPTLESIRGIVRS